jgi:hypothetical protein
MNRRPLLILILLTVMLFYLGISFAQIDKSLSEEKGAAVTSDPVGKAMSRIKSAEEKTAKIKSKIKKGKIEGIETLAAEYEQDIKDVQDNVDKAMALGKDVTSVSEVVEKATAKHTEVLNEVLNKVPEQAKAAIRHAIEVSQRGRQKALENLQKKKGKPEKIGEPEVKGKSEEVREPKGVGKPEGVGNLKRTGKPESVGEPEKAGRPTGIPAGGSGGRGGGRGR